MNRDGSAVLNATVVRLLLAAFVVALATTGFVFTVPFFVLHKLGRTDAVGQVVATWTIGYIVSCLISQHLAGKFSPRVLVSLATIGVAIFIFVFRFATNVTWMATAGLGYGLSLGMFWAPLMGWLSGDAEGVTLSRRLGWFNISWSSSVILAPIIGGYLIKHSIELPFVVMAGVMAVGCAIALTTRRTRRERKLHPPITEYQAAPEPADPASTALPGETESATERPLLSPLKTRYIRFFGWTGACVAYIAIAVYRYQMPHLAKTVHMDEVVFGWVITTLSLALTAAFFVTARWTGWHGKTRWIFVPQIVLMVVSGLLTLTTNPWILGTLMLAGGFCGGLLYTTSVFYGSLGAPASMRTRRMAIHEIALNIGVITGSYLGNLLSQHLGPSQVYPYLAGAIAVAVAGQLVLWNLLLLRRQPDMTPALGLNPALDE